MSKNKQGQNEKQPKSGGRIKREDVAFEKVEGTTKWRAMYNGHTAEGGDPNSAFNRLREQNS